MKLVLFDLDHTLLPIDSADTWTRHLVRCAGMDIHAHDLRLERFRDGYYAGRFDIDGYLAYQLGLLAQCERADLERWRAAFIEERIVPNLRPQALALVEEHRREGALLALATGTNAFVTEPIGALFGLQHVLAVRPSVGPDGRFTGGYDGDHTYGPGKIRAVERFLAQRGTSLDALADSLFYSDSINDLPLLQRVRTPVVTNGDEALRGVAAQRGWRTIELFETIR